MNIAIIDYGAGNIRSLEYAFDRLGVKAQATSDAEDIMTADKVIFPGVGHAAPALESLKETGLFDLIPKLKQDVLGICLGMQLMCSYLEEADADGLKIFPMSVTRFQTQLKVPHMGWNRLSTSENESNADEEYVYFVHSYFAECHDDYTIATCDYDGRFSATIKKQNFIGCQFHPEKSGVVGQQILQSFINGTLGR